MKKLPLIAIATTCIIYSLPVKAQLSVGHFGNMTVQTGLTKVMTDTINQGSQNSQTANPTQTSSNKRQSSNSLAFQTNSAISRQVKQEFISRFRNLDPSSVSAIEKYLSSQDIVAIFAKDIKPYNLEADNVADIMTAYMAMMWIIVNDSDLPQIREVAAIQQSLQSSLTPVISSMNNDKRQYIGESFIYETWLAIGLRNEFLSNPDKRKAFADSTHQNLLNQGMDFRSIVLTEKGFVPKR